MLTIIPLPPNRFYNQMKLLGVYGEWNRNSASQLLLSLYSLYISVMNKNFLLTAIETSE